MWALVALRWVEMWAAALQANGALDLTADVLRRRLETFGRDLLHGH